MIFKLPILSPLQADELRGKNREARRARKYDRARIGDRIVALGVNRRIHERRLHEHAQDQGKRESERGGAAE